MVRMYSEGKPLSSISAETGYSVSAIKARRRALNLTPRRRLEVPKCKVSVQLSRELTDRLKIAAKEFNTSLSVYIRRVLENDVKKWDDR